jgi:phage major head subunit gpT-like protein
VPLNTANYTATRAAMMGEVMGRILGIAPTVMIAPPELQDAAQHLLNTETNDGGRSNP